MTRAAGSPIVVERVFDAPPQAVFAAWRDPESLAAWMAPGADFGRADVELEFQVGGAFRIAMHGADGDFVQRGEYLEIDEPKRLVFTWISEWMPEGERATRVSVFFEPEGGGTRLRLVHDQLPASDAYEGHVAGWAAILEHGADALSASTP